MNASPQTPRVLYAGQEERRVSVRLRNYWVYLRNGRPFPSRRDIDIEMIKEMWPFAFMLDVSRGEKAARFVHVGARIARFSGVHPSVQTPAQLLKGSLLADACKRIDRVLEGRCPVFGDGKCSTPGGAMALYRSVLLPLGDDALLVGSVLGVATHRNVSG